MKKVLKEEEDFFNALGEQILKAMKQSANGDNTLESTSEHLKKNLDYMKEEGWIEGHSVEE